MIVTKKGKKVSAIVSVEDLLVIEALEDHFDISIAESVIKNLQKIGTTSWKEAKRKLKL